MRTTVIFCFLIFLSSYYLSSQARSIQVDQIQWQDIEGWVSSKSSIDRYTRENKIASNSILNKLKAQSRGNGECSCTLIYLNLTNASIPGFAQEFTPEIESEDGFGHFDKYYQAGRLLSGEQSV